MSVAEYDTDTLRGMRDAAMTVAEHYRDRAKELHDEIIRRTSPWPWPKTPSLIAQVWATESIKQFAERLARGRPFQYRA